MKGNLAYVLINPYTIAKSRTGGVIGRYFARTGLNLVAARMFGPSEKLVKEYIDLVMNDEGEDKYIKQLLVDYIKRSYMPDKTTGKPHRVMMLVFEGENAVEKIKEVTGPPTSRVDRGLTIRDTYGDYIVDKDGSIKYFEPAVMVASSAKIAEQGLKLWAKYSETDGGMIDYAVDVPQGENVEKTLVLLKPDSFKFPSIKPGNIIDILSASGLRIVCVKLLKMTVAQAEEFYFSVKDSLKLRFEKHGVSNMKHAIKKEFDLDIPDDVAGILCKYISGYFASREFEKIIEFITGYIPSACCEKEKAYLGKEISFALVYAGVNAVEKIRNLVGATDPMMAKPGSVRREFGSNILMNAIHASDSVENALREMKVLKIEEDTLNALIDQYKERDIIEQFGKVKSFISWCESKILAGIKKIFHNR